MNPKLDLKREASAPCWAWKWQFEGIKKPPYSESGVVVNICPPSYRKGFVKVRVITERAWRQIRRELENYRKLQQVAQKFLLKSKGKR